MKFCKKICLIFALVILTTSALAITSSAASKETCGWCGKYCSDTYCSGKSAGIDNKEIKCVVHDNCKITKRELRFATATPGKACGCTNYLRYNHINRSHSDYTTHTAAGRYYTCVYTLLAY